MVADALAQGCDTLVTVGKLQSNHARQTAAAAAASGLSCVLLLEALSADDSVTYADNGNALLNRLLGAETVVFAPGMRTDEAVALQLERLSASGRRPYAIPVGGSDAVGSVGYADAAIELHEQLSEQQIGADLLVLATGSCGSQAGLLVGNEMVGSALSVLGFSVSHPGDVVSARVLEIAGDCCRQLGVELPPSAAVAVDDRFVGPGYGKVDRRTVEAVELVARTEGVILDPVYTGKAAAGLIDGCRSGRFGSHERIVFLHTGGQAGAFAYSDAL